MFHWLADVIDRQGVVYLRGDKLGTGVAAPADHADIVGTSLVESLTDDRADVDVLPVSRLAGNDEQHRARQLTQLEIESNLAAV